MREEKLKSSDYQDKIKQVKLWAVCDKTVEEFGLENIYASENEATRLHGVHEIAQKIRTLKIEETPPQSQNEKKIKPQFSKSSSFGEVRTKEFFNKKEKNTVKNETQDKNLAKKGSFDAGKSTEKKEVKEVKPVERKNTQEITKKPTKSEQFAQQIIEEPQPAKASADSKKKKATTDLNDEIEQPLKKTKANTKDVTAESSSVRPKVDDNINSYFKKIQTKSSQKFEAEEDVPITSTREENIDEYFKHKKQSQENIEEPKINISIKQKPSKIEPEEEEYYGGYIEEPVRERSPGAEQTEHKPKKVAKKITQEISAPYVEPKACEFKEEKGVVFVKKMKQVPKEKSYIDEKGYLVVETIYEEEPYWEEIKRNSATSTQVLPQTQSAKKQPEKNQPTLAF